MLQNNSQREAGRSIFMSSIQGVATTVALAATVVGAPVIYNFSIDWEQSFTARQYGYGLEDIAAVVWGGTCASIVFFVARASVGTALVMGGLAVATRFL